jgi:hypothetical protein
MDVDACVLVGLDPQRQVQRVRVQQRGLIEHRPSVVAIVRLHPGGRGVGDAPELDVGVHRLGRLNERNEVLFVALDRKLHHVEVVIGLVQGVAIH